jgi:hypothetical protein
MNIHFRPLLTVSIQHSYYAGACTDLEFVAPSSTAGLLHGGRVLARLLDGRLHLLFAADSLGTPINNLAGHTLTFGLRLVNPCFTNFTEAVVSDAALLPFYTNSHNPVALDVPHGISLTSGRHPHTPLTVIRPLTLRLSDSSGAIVHTQVLRTGDTVGSFDLRALAEGVYQIDEDAGGGSLATSPLYVSTELRSAGVWGIIAIKLDAGFYVNPPALSLEFSARQEQLKYFVVASNFTSTEFDQLEVSDNGFNDEGRARLTFQKVPPELFSDSEISPALLGDGSRRIVMFRSQVPVAWRKRGFRKIQLNRNGDVLIEHLPQPGADRSQAHLIVHLAKPD